MVRWFPLRLGATPGRGTVAALKPGNTPLVELRSLGSDRARLWAKLEWYNPTGSVKDRAAWFMYENAVRDGKLAPGVPLVEATSGNTGIGLARLALIHRRRMVICLPTAATPERKHLLRAYQAELIEVEGGPNDAIAHARELVEAGEGHMLFQYGNRWNAYAHLFGTAQEILKQWPDPRPPTHFFAAYGTGGTLTGNSRGLLAVWPELRIHSVEPFVDDPIGGMRSQDDPFQPPVADLSRVTDRHQVGKAIAERQMAETMELEGMFVGTSSGAILHAAREVLAREGGTAVAVLPDAGWKYLSGPPWLAPAVAG